METKIKNLLARLAFFAEEGMAEPPIVAIAKDADALLKEMCRAQPEPVSQQLTAAYIRSMAAGLYDGMGGHADACSKLMERLAKDIAAAEQAQQAEPVADAMSQFEAIKSARRAHAAGEISTDELRARLDAIFGEDAQLLAQRQAEPVARDVLMALKSLVAALNAAMPYMQTCEGGVGPDCTKQFQALIDGHAAIAAAEQAQQAEPVLNIKIGMSTPLELGSHMRVEGTPSGALKVICTREHAPAVAEPVALSESEFKFLEFVRNNPNRKCDCAWSNDGPLWPRLEELGLIRATGSYKWECTPAVSLSIAAQPPAQPVALRSVTNISMETVGGNHRVVLHVGTVGEMYELGKVIRAMFAAEGCGACGDGCKGQGCRLERESPPITAEPVEWLKNSGWARVPLREQPIAVAAPAGYQIVPVEPTTEMVLAGAEDDSQFFEHAKWVYRAMLAAAPQAAGAVPDVCCQHCLGSGVIPKAAILPEPPDVKCQKCNGTGMLAAVQKGGD